MPSTDHTTRGRKARRGDERWAPMWIFFLLGKKRPLRWVSQSQARRVKFILSEEGVLHTPPQWSSKCGFCIPTDFSWISGFPAFLLGVLWRVRSWAGCNFQTQFKENWVKWLSVLAKKVQEPLIIHSSLSPSSERLRTDSSTKSAIILHVPKLLAHMITREWYVAWCGYKLFY